MAFRDLCSFHTQTASVDVDGLLGFSILRLIYFPHTPSRFLYMCLRVPRGDYRIMGPEKQTKNPKYKKLNFCL